MNGKEKEQMELDEIKKALNEDGYEFQISLGKGSYGQVVQAKHSTFNQTYAIKLIRAVEKETEKYRQREVDALTKLDQWIHIPNIIKYFRSWKMNIGNDPFLCISMELCRISLRAFVYQNEMGGAKIIQYPRFYQHVFPQILKGLVAIHSIGWVHRDIHIGNILIANPKPSQISDIVIKIADFGIAREIGPIIDASTSLTDAPKLEKLTSGVGNKFFRAPELSTNEYDYKVDLFSAGIVLYFLSRYLGDKTRWKAEFSELRDRKRDWRHVHHRDDENLTKLITWLLKEDPKQRPDAAQALQHMLSKKDTESTDAGKPVAKDFFVKRKGGEAMNRCGLKDDTLSSLKAEIALCTSVEVGSQVLQQRRTIQVGVEPEMVNITSDWDVRCMFQSAEKAGEKVVIIVTEVDDVSDMDVEFVSSEARELAVPNLP